MDWFTPLRWLNTTQTHGVYDRCVGLWKTTRKNKKLSFRKQKALDLKLINAGVIYRRIVKTVAILKISIRITKSGYTLTA